jgi:hypothetical protein
MSLKLHGEVSLDGSGWEAGLEKMRHGTAHAVSELKSLAIQAVGIYSMESRSCKC